MDGYILDGRSWIVFFVPSILKILFGLLAAVLGPVAGQRFRIGQRQLQILYRIPLELAVVVVAAIENVGSRKAAFGEARAVSSAAYHLFFEGQTHRAGGLMRKRHHA